MEADKHFEMMELYHDKANIPRLCLSHLSPHTAIVRELCIGDREGPVVPGVPVFFWGCYGHVFGSRPSQVKQATKVEHWCTDNTRRYGNRVRRTWLLYIVIGSNIWREG